METINVRDIHKNLFCRSLYFSKKSRLANLSKEGKIETKIEQQDEMLYEYAKRKIIEYPDLDFTISISDTLPLAPVTNLA